MLSLPSTRRAVAVLAAVGTAFTLGVVAGAAGRSQPVPGPGVLDAAAEQIAAAALEPVDREALSGAAIEGMLRAAGDPWGSWSERASRTKAGSGALAVTYLSTRAGGARVARIRVSAFSRGVGRELRAAVRSVQGTGVVLDLRGNPGGLLDEAVETASAFLDGGPVVSYARRGGASVRLDALTDGDVRVPLVVLVDGGTASAAEVVAGALQDRGRAVLVGSRTFGKGTVQEPRALEDGSALQLTVARYRTPSGRSLEGAGLEPDIEVTPGQAASVAERRAVEVLTGLVADSGGGRG